MCTSLEDLDAITNGKFSQDHGNKPINPLAREEEEEDDVDNDENQQAEKSTPTPSPMLFLTSSTTIAITLIRIGFLIPKEWITTPFNKIGDDSVIGWLLHSKDIAPFWISTLCRPFETWDHVVEAKAIRQLFSTSSSSSSFRAAYYGSNIHLPPLVLAALESILDLVVPTTTAGGEELAAKQSFVTGCIAHLTDLAIAIQLLQLGKLILLDPKLQDPFEEELLPKIPESLRPPLETVIPIVDDDQQPLIYTNELPPKKKKVEEKKKNEEEEGDGEEENEKTEDSQNDNNSQEDEEASEKSQDDKDYVPPPPPFAYKEFPLLAAQLYYYSPFTALASGLGTTHHSFQNLWLLMLLVGMHKACSGGLYYYSFHDAASSNNNKIISKVIPLSTFHLALASYMEYQYFVYLIPMSLWLQRRQRSQNKRNGQNDENPNNSNVVAQCFLFYIFWVACLQGLTVLLVGQSQYASVMYSSFGHVFTWKSLHPNLSVLWYMNMELFERYRIYFSILIGGLPYLLVVPLTIRLHRYPMVLTTIFWMLWTLIRPTSTLVDANVGLALATLCPRSLARMRVPTTLVPALAITVPITLYMVTLWMWLETGAGEANFTFFQCLAYCAFLSTIFLEFCGASIRRDKVLRLTQKELQKQQQQQEVEKAMTEDEQKGNASKDKKEEKDGPETKNK